MFDQKSRARRNRKNKKDHEKFKIPEIKHGNLEKEFVKNDLSVNIFATHSNSIIEKESILSKPKKVDLDLIVKDKIFMSDDTIPALTPVYSEENNQELSVIEISSEVDKKEIVCEKSLLEVEKSQVSETGGVFSYITSFFW